MRYRSTLVLLLLIGLVGCDTSRSSDADAIARVDLREGTTWTYAVETQQFVPRVGQVEPDSLVFSLQGTAVITVAAVGERVGEEGGLIRLEGGSDLYGPVREWYRYAGRGLDGVAYGRFPGGGGGWLTPLAPGQKPRAESAARLDPACSDYEGGFEACIREQPRHIYRFPLEEGRRWTAVSVEDFFDITRTVTAVGDTALEAGTFRAATIELAWTLDGLSGTELVGEEGLLSREIRSETRSDGGGMELYVERTELTRLDR